MPAASTKEAFKNIALLIAALLALFLIARWFDFSALRSYVEAAGAWGPLILIAAKASTIVVAPLSGSPLYPIAGALWGFWKAFALLCAADAIGSSIAFWISRRYGRSVTDRFLGKDSGILSEVLELMGTVRGFALARLAFASFPEVAAYGAGLTRIGYLPFITIHMAVALVPNAILTSLGVFLAGGGSTKVFILLLFGGMLVSGASLLLFYRILGRERARRENIPL